MEFADWAFPIVPVVKTDGSVRLCGDYKVTVNQVAKLDKYPILRIDDLFSSLEGGKTFSKLDLAHAYQQIPLDNDSKKFTTLTQPRDSTNTTNFLLVFHLLHLYFRELWKESSKVFQGCQSTLMTFWSQGKPNKII